MKKKFKFQYGGWTGSLLPSPEGMLHSKFADKIDVTNITSMNNQEIDKLIEQYNECWNPDKRIKILQELDYIASSEYHWIFGWAAPYGYSAGTTRKRGRSQLNCHGAERELRGAAERRRNHHH